MNEELAIEVTKVKLCDLWLSTGSEKVQLLSCNLEKKSTESIFCFIAIQYECCFEEFIL